MRSPSRFEIASLGGFAKMPIYEYECTNCGKIEEVMQKFSDKPLKKCKHCSGKLHKLVSLSSFHLKGTGWYVTDYSGKNNNAASHPDRSETSSSGKKEKTSSTGAKKTADSTSE